MKTKLAVLTVLAIALLVSSVSAGNGIDLNGKHFTLNLIGQEKEKNMPVNLSGHTIFVEYNPHGTEAVTTKIMLQEGDFAVIDKDGTDGTARFQLPYPYSVFSEGVIPEDTETCYKVYARALGKPEGSADMYACAYDEVADMDYCYTGEVITITRPTAITGKNGPSKFVDITRQLTTITFEGADYSIFANPLYDYFWKYENDKLKHAQLRFYPTADCADSPYF